MKVKKELVAEVVAEASKKMSEANYSANMVGGFVQAQAPVAQFISAHDTDLGGAEAIVNVIFHCALINECLRRSGGRPRTLSYEDLDAVAQGNSLLGLEKKQPALADFIASNIENVEAQKLIALIALALAATS
jgi:hypothetical protein